MTAKAAMVASTICSGAPRSLRRLPDHHGGQDEQQSRLDQRGDAFDLAVTVMVFLVGGFTGNADGEIRHQRRGEIDQ